MIQTYDYNDNDVTMARVVKCHGYDGYIRVKICLQVGVKCLQFCKIKPFWTDLGKEGRLPEKNVKSLVFYQTPLGPDV